MGRDLDRLLHPDNAPPYHITAVRRLPASHSLAVSNRSTTTTASSSSSFSSSFSPTDPCAAAVPPLPPLPPQPPPVHASSHHPASNVPYAWTAINHSLPHASRPPASLAPPRQEASPPSLAPPHPSASDAHAHAHPNSLRWNLPHHDSQQENPSVRDLISADEAEASAAPKTPPSPTPSPVQRLTISTSSRPAYQDTATQTPSPAPMMPPPPALSPRPPHSLAAVPQASPELAPQPSSTRLPGEFASPAMPSHLSPANPAGYSQANASLLQDASQSCRQCEERRTAAREYWEHRMANLIPTPAQPRQSAGSSAQTFSQKMSEWQKVTNAHLAAVKEYAGACAECHHHRSNGRIQEAVDEDAAEARKRKATADGGPTDGLTSSKIRRVHLDTPSPKCQRTPPPEEAAAGSNGPSSHPPRAVESMAPRSIQSSSSHIRRMLGEEEARDNPDRYHMFSSIDDLDEEDGKSKGKERKDSGQVPTVDGGP